MQDGIITEGFNIIEGTLKKFSAVLRLMSVAVNGDRDIQISGDFHKVREGRNFINGVTIKRAGIDVKGNVISFNGVCGA